MRKSWIILSFVSHLNRNDIIHLFRVSAPIPKKISQILPKFQNVAQTSHYLVEFGLPSGTQNDNQSLRDFLRRKGIDNRFHTSDIGLLCSTAFLPGSTFATTVVNGEFQGVTETIPHTRNFTRIKLEFYVDNEYKSLKFLEHWMEYITGAQQQSSIDNAYNFKLNYPSDYRSQSTRIIKFERNYRQTLEYNFRGLFPIALDSTKVQYQNSNVLKASCSFAYERYICGKASSFSKAVGDNQNQSSSAAGIYGNRPAGSIINPGVADTDERYNELKSFTDLPNSKLSAGAYFGNDALSGNVISEGYYGG